MPSPFLRKPKQRNVRWVKDRPCSVLRYIQFVLEQLKARHWRAERTPLQIQFDLYIYRFMLHCILFFFDYYFRHWNCFDQSMRSLHDFIRCLTMVWDGIPMKVSCLPELAERFKDLSKTPQIEEHWGKCIIFFQTFFSPFVLLTVALHSEIHYFTVIKCVQKRYSVITYFL